MNSSVIISGEASETDSDEDINYQDKKMTTSIQGAVIMGEDSESDDENGASISSAVSALSQTSKDTNERDALQQERNESLLHKKLRDCNNQLHTGIQSFCQNLISQAEKNLQNIDQQLLKSQNTLQSAVSSLRTISINSAILKDKLQYVVSAKFISNIKTDLP